MLSFSKSLSRPDFWRTTQQQEIDYIEISGDAVSALKFKWSLNKKIKLPKSFQETYQPSFKIISKENFREILK